eukprot:gene19917-25877_t
MSCHIIYNNYSIEIMIGKFIYVIMNAKIHL